MSRIHITVEIMFLRTFKMASLCLQAQFQLIFRLSSVGII